MTREDTNSLWQFLRRKASRWIGTPWWNLRFTLGYRIGGFTSVTRNYDTEGE